MSRKVQFSCALLLLLAVSAPAFAVRPKDLPPRYRAWLEEEVPYIITSEEKEAFLILVDGPSRDKFIERFWEVRNPSPGAPTNPYKEEHYRRVAHANTYFKGPAGKEGWRTDQGRIYITLGEPKQKAPYMALTNTRPMLIWFYDNANPALPPFFYIVFYQREEGGEWRLYSPYFDGPQRLVTSHDAEKDRYEAWKSIDRSAGREVARTVLSLLPDEPVDYREARSSLQSDVMLAKIRGLADHPLSKAQILQKRALLESVTHRLVLSGEYLNVLTVPLRDNAGNMNLHYLLRLQRPEDFAVAQDNDRYYYSFEVQTRVMTAAGKPVYTQQRKLSKYLNEREFQEMKGKPFGFYSVLPLAPGKYKVEFLFTNVVQKTALKADREVTIPDAGQTGLRLSDVMAFTRAEQADPAKGQTAPFTFAGVHFVPLLNQEMTVAPGENLNVLYQIWAPHEKTANAAGKKLLVDYAYGRLGLTGDVKKMNEEIDLGQFDPGGSLISGKKIATDELGVGNYRLTLTVTDPDSQQKAFASMAFKVLPHAPGSASESFDVADPELSEEAMKGVLDYQRALAFLANGAPDQAAPWLRQAVNADPENEIARGKLVDYYFGKQAFKEISDLYARGGVSKTTDEQTVLKVAESMDKIGLTQRAIDLLENAVLQGRTSGPIYLSLSSYYQKVGNQQKAAEAEKKGKSLMPATT